MSLTDAIDTTRLLEFQMRVDAEKEERWREYLGEQREHYDRWAKAERETREALTRAFLATNERDLSNALRDMSRLQDVLYEGLQWKRLRLRFYERDLAPVLIPLKPEGA